MSVSRRKFIESIGATCLNWQWSWSFVNKEERFVIFGAWKHFEKNDLQLIFSEDWRFDANNKKTNGFNQSLRHLELVEEENFSLYTFPMEAVVGTEDHVPKIKRIIPEKNKKHLIVNGSNYYAASTNEFLEDKKPNLIQGPSGFLEGAKYSVTQTLYERSLEARQACIDHYGYACRCCGLNFEEKYGEVGRGFIHVHHLVPVSKRPNGYQVNPVKDLIPVCPNCHAMIHKKTKPGPYSVEEIKAKLASGGKS